jgi:ABC-2 type transport system ATP-binding protein
MRMLSGGMKRRVLIAQALVHKPAVVILDEPTAGVDVELRRTLWQFMRELHKNGTTVVLTTHYLEEAQEMCGRIAILNKGELKALEPTQTLLSRHPYRFLKVRLNGELPSALQALKVSASTTGDIELRLDTRQHAMSDILSSLQSAGIVDVATREPTLEDIFVEMTK